jgi:hypothetical protein
MAQSHDKFAGMVLDSYAEVHRVLTRRFDSAMFHFMFGRCLILCASTLLLALPYQSVSRQQEPWLGTWSLNLGNAESVSYRRVRTRSEPWEDGLRVTYDMVGIRGGVTHLEWTGRFDAKDYPMQGVDYVMTNAYRRIDNQSYEIVIKIDGVTTATARVSVSPDGRKLSVATAERSSNGQPKTTTTTYERL